MRIRVELLVFVVALVGVVVYKASRWDDVNWIAPEADPSRAATSQLTPSPDGGDTSADPLTEEFAPGQRPAPMFALNGQKGRMVRLDALKGGVVMFNVFATWCEPCLEELPFVEDLQKRYAAKGLTVVLASWDKSPEELRKKWNPDASALTLAYDTDRAVGNRFGTTKVPEAYLIDRRGDIRFKFTHARRWTATKYLDIVEKLLGEPPPASPAAAPMRAP